MTRRSVAMLAAVGALVVVAVGVTVVVSRHSGRSSASVPAVPRLGAADHRALLAARPLVERLDQAITEIPVAASDASGRAITVTAARRIITRQAAFAPLARALSSPAATSGGLAAAYRAVLAGGSVRSPASLATWLEALQTTEGDVVPAVRVVAATEGRSLSASAALAAITADSRTPALAALVSQWSQLYGAFTLVEQAAAS